MEWLVVLLVLLRLSDCVQLNCVGSPSSYKIPDRIDVQVFKLDKFGFHPGKPYAYDVNGNRHTAPHLFVSSEAKYFCSFKINKYFITREGIIMPSMFGVDKLVRLDHKTISGVADPNYSPSVSKKFNDKFAARGKKYKSSGMDQLDVVVPLRMPWDERFNHQSFQLLPMVGSIFNFYKPIWNDVFFHCSMYTAAMMNVIGVPMNRLIIEKNIFANQILLPWIPKWIPPHSASMFNISAEMCDLLTKSLLTMRFDDSVIQSLQPLTISSPSHPDSINELTAIDVGFRYIVYISRAQQSVRDVYKERDLLTMISNVIDKSKYRLVVVGPSVEYEELVVLQASWQRCAQIFSKAILMIGPHGGSWNNVIFTPPDCHFIEFNYMIEQSYVVGSTPVRSHFLTAHFAKGGSGKFYIIEPNNVTNKTPPDLYFEGWMKVSQRDVLKTLLLINKDVPDLLSDANVNVLSVPELSLEDLQASTKKDSWIMLY